MSKKCTVKDSHDNYTFEKFTTKDLGETFLYKNKALITRSSGMILFFKLTFNDFKKKYFWNQYHSIEAAGRVYFIPSKSAKQLFQIITIEKILFYSIDENTLMPILDSIITNFMSCSVMMFGPKGEFCITFKQSDNGFEIYKRKNIHDYKVCIKKEDF